MLSALILVHSLSLTIVPNQVPTPTLQQVTVNNTPGDQFDPHISTMVVAYSNVTGVDQSIRYYVVNSGQDFGIPPGVYNGQPSSDLLSDTFENLIVYTRVIPLQRTAVMLYDIKNSTNVEIAPTPGANRIGVAIGLGTIAYSDLATSTNGTGEIYAFDMNTSVLSRLTNDLIHDQNPKVSPDGTIVAWEHCAANIFNCDIMAATRTGGVWTVVPIAFGNTPEQDPAASNSLVVYTANRGSTGTDLQIHSLATGQDYPVEFPGDEMHPSIAGDVVAFVSLAPGAVNADIYVYQISANRVFQITNTPLYNESLNGIAVLPNGDVGVVWDCNDEDGINRNIYMATFTPPPANPTITHLIPPTIYAPSSITVDATSPSGAIVTYTATATDIVDPNPSIVCTPPSGALFPIGITLVSCIATNVYGRQAQQNITVTVRSAAQIASDLGPLIVSFQLQSQFSNGLLNLVQQLVTEISSGKTQASCGDTTAAINQIKAQTGKKFTVVQANQLIADLIKVKAALGCP